jgi:hypothetical protein
MRHWFSLLFAAVVTLSCGLLRPFDGLGTEELRTASSVFAQVSATMLGFLIAALSILATIANTILVQNMQKTGHYLFFLKRTFVTAAAYGVTMLVALVGTISFHIEVWGILLVVFLASWSTALLIDFGYRFWMVLTHLKPS